MFSIDRSAKRRRTGVAYTPGRGPTLTNKANFVLMNGKIVDRSQFMGVNFKDDTRNQTFVNIAEAGYASDAIASRGVSSDGPINVQATGQSMLNIRELAGFLSMLIEDDKKIAKLILQYKSQFAEMYAVNGNTVTPIYNAYEQGVNRDNLVRIGEIIRKIDVHDYPQAVLEQVDDFLNNQERFYTPSSKAIELTNAERLLADTNQAVPDNYDKTDMLQSIRATARKTQVPPGVGEVVDRQVDNQLRRALEYFDDPDANAEGADVEAGDGHDANGLTDEQRRGWLLANADAIRRGEAPAIGVGEFLQGQPPGPDIEI